MVKFQSKHQIQKITDAKQRTSLKGYIGSINCTYNKKLKVETLFLTVIINYVINGIQAILSIFLSRSDLDPDLSEKLKNPLNQ